MVNLLFISFIMRLTCGLMIQCEYNEGLILFYFNWYKVVTGQDINLESLLLYAITN